MAKAKTYYDIKVKTSTFVLGDEYGGAEMELVVEMSLQDYLDLKAMTDVRGFQDDATEEEVAEAMTTFTDRVRAWGDNIIEKWNIRRKNVELPATGDGFLRLPHELRNAILRTWMEHMGNVDPKLSEGSKNGKQSGGRSTRRLASRSKGRAQS